MQRPYHAEPPEIPLGARRIPRNAVDNASTKVVFDRYHGGPVEHLSDRGSPAGGSSGAAGSDDLCFITQHTPEQVVAHLQARQVRLEAGPVERAGALGPMTSVYCRDPDGNLIELAWYPPAGG